MLNKRQTLFFIICSIIVLFTGHVSAEQETLGTFKQNSNIILYQVCNNCSYNNISYVSAPNLTTLISNKAMTKNGVQYSYTLSSGNTSEFGRYIVCGFGDNDGTVATWCYDFFINTTGRDEPAGSVVTFFLILFLIVCAVLTYLFVYSIGHFIKNDFDIIDLAFNFGIYFVLLGLYIMQQQYNGNPLMDNILHLLVYVGAFTHIFSASIFFFISMFRASADQKNFVESGGVK